MNPRATQRRYLLLILSSTFLQGSSFVASKVVLTELPPLWLAALRFFVASMTLLPWLWLRHRARIAAGTAVPVAAMPWLRLAVIGLLQTAGVMAFLTMGLTQTTASKAAILMASNPLLVALLAGILLKERVRPLAWLGLLLAFAGVVVCIGVQSVMSGAIGHGEALVMAGSACWAFATLASKRFRLAVDTWTLAFWQMLIGAVALTLLAAWHGESFAMPAHYGGCVPVAGHSRFDGCDGIMVRGLAHGWCRAHQRLSVSVSVLCRLDRFCPQRRNALHPRNAGRRDDRRRHCLAVPDTRRAAGQPCCLPGEFSVTSPSVSPIHAAAPAAANPFAARHGGRSHAQAVLW
nr:DMT family transporter [Xanthomonas arboricola]